MAPSIVHVPNGQTLTVTPVFGGIQFKANDLNTHQNVFPPGWTIIINSEDYEEDHAPKASSAAHTVQDPDFAPKDPLPPQPRRLHTHRFRRPTLRNDHIFISAISNPPSTEFRPPTSPTRQIAMMLWATLWWYFHQPAPSPYLATPTCEKTPELGKPKGEWRININREGIFKSKHLLPKLERMGLITSEDSTVGTDPEDGVSNTAEGWSHMFVSQRTFWQLDARIYLFTLSPTQASSPFPSVSPAGSRPASPNRGNTSNIASNMAFRNEDSTPSLQAATAMAPHLSRHNTPPGPFHSGSHLPTFYPPPPPQYTFTNGTRHPVRSKPPRQGEMFYARYVPSLGQYLSFRVASLSPHPVILRGPTSATAPDAMLSPGVRESLRRGPGNATPPSFSDSVVPTFKGLKVDDTEASNLSDVELLHKWMNDERVSYSWGEQGPQSHQEDFLKHCLTSKHSFPVIGSFDNKPFGFFEIYWVKEDRLYPHLGGQVDDWDRGLHCLVGEQEFRGPHRVKVWLSALVHYCWLADLRTNVVMMEPRVDNEKLKKYCEEVGFYKEREVALPHKQSNLMKIRREAWEAPAL